MVIVSVLRCMALWRVCKQAQEAQEVAPSWVLASRRAARKQQQNNDHNGYNGG